MNVKDVFQKLLDKARAYSWRRFGRTRKPSNYTSDGKPGELVNSLSPDELEVLRTLTSADISIEKIPRGQIDYFADNSEDDLNSSYIKEEKLKFDKKIINK